MLQIYLYLDKRRETKKGFPVKLMVYDTKEQKQRQISFGEYQKGKILKMTSQLSVLMQEFHDRVDFCNEHGRGLEESVKIIKDGYGGNKELELIVLEKRIKELKKEKFVDFEEFARKFIEERRSQNFSVRHFEEAISQLRNFLGDKRLNINDITYEFLNQYIIYKRKLTTGTGAGINTTMRALRTIYKEAQRRDSLEIKKDNPFLGIMANIPTSTPEIEYWKKGDIKKLLNFQPRQSTSNVSKENMQKIIDVFLFQFAIGGHDLADVANFEWKNIKEDRLVFRRFKNRNKTNKGELVDVMLSPFALAVIEKYGDKGSTRIFTFLDAPSTTKYTKQNQYVARTLARVSDSLGIPKIRTKTPRYLFRTYAGELFINDLIIMSIQGHKSTSVTHLYQKTIPHKIQDTEHQKVLNLIF